MQQLFFCPFETYIYIYIIIYISLLNSCHFLERTSKTCHQFIFRGIGKKKLIKIIYYQGDKTMSSRFLKLVKRVGVFGTLNRTYGLQTRFNLSCKHANEKQIVVFDISKLQSHLTFNMFSCRHWVRANESPLYHVCRCCASWIWQIRSPAPNYLTPAHMCAY